MQSVIEPSISLSKFFLDAIRFAQFCAEQNLHPVNAAELITLAKQAFKARLMNAVNPSDNTGLETSSDRTSRKLEKYAENLGYTVKWDGSCPSLLKDGETIEIYSMF